MPPKKLPPSHVGFSAERGCTDIAFTILYIIMGILFIVLAATVYKNGDPNRLIYGTDRNGKICGHGENPYPNKITNWSAYTKLWYPVGYDTDRQDFILKDALKMGICVTECPSAGSAPPTYETSTSYKLPVLFTSKSLFHRCIPNLLSYNCDAQFSNTSAMYKACSSLKGAKENSIQDATSQAFQSGFAELTDNIGPIAGAAGICVVVAFLWLFILRRTVKPMVVLTIIILFALLIAVTVMLWMHHTTLKDQNRDESASYFMYGSIAAGIFTFLLLCLVLFLAKDIMIACDIIEEASKVPLAIPTMLLIPVIGFLFIIPLCFFNGSVGIYIQASGNLTFGNLTFFDPMQNSTVNFGGVGTYKYDDWRIPAHIFNLLMFLWTLSFVTSLVFFTVALCAVFWYWSNPGDDKKPPVGSVLTAVRIAFRYHTGTIAFGSLLIAIVQVMRIILECTEERMKKYTGNAEAVKWIVTCMQCCLACFEKFLKFMNRNAYIVCAMTGENFLASAQHALSLLLAHAFSVGAVNIVGEWVMFFGKIIIVTISTLSGWGILMKVNPDANGLIVVVFIGILTYVIASIFINVFGACIDAVLLSYCYDLEINDGSDSKPFYCPSDLLKHIDKIRTTKGEEIPVSPANNLEKPLSTKLAV
eukprot:PhF_6_TR37608/c0_g1_i4/m.55868/K15377/SLC44A2_4_5; solute carrier family 44 (choline transporter-like protein), member 2/4/5